jgi:DNA-binding MarR family transcriptional regulator
MKATAGRLASLLGYQVRRAQVRAFQSFAQAAGGMGLTPMLFGVLVVLDERPGVTQTELADALGADPSTMVRMLDQLEKRAWVKREPSPVDRRSTLPVLTDTGRAILAEALPLVVESDRRIASALTADERETLLDLLRRI